MKVLFIPNRDGAISHGIPLLALSKLLNTDRYRTAFLIPQQVHHFFKTAGAYVLGMDHEGLRTEMLAYDSFKPDVVIDDLSLSTAVGSALKHLPRVTIQRLGTFPGSSETPGYHHSATIDLSLFIDFTKLDLPKPRNIADLANGDAIIVPAIRSIEPLPDSCPEHNKYFYAGPLLINDYFSSDSVHFTRHFRRVQRFFDIHAAAPVIYITLGNMAKPHKLLLLSIRSLVEMGHPIISNVKLPGAPLDPDYYLQAAYLPSHYVCSRSSLIIHHCGSATYHYPIIHQKPFIVVGTGTSDRDGVAMRLAKLGAGSYLLPPDACPDFYERLRQEIRAHFGGDPQLIDSRRQVLRELKGELDRTTQAFKLEEAIAFATRCPAKN